MNKDDDIELLETSTNFQASQLSSNVEAPHIPSEMEANSQKTSSTSINVEKAGISSSKISPLVSKPNVVGTTANSPRISPDATFASTSHSMKQQFVPKDEVKSTDNTRKTEESALSNGIVNSSLENKQDFTKKSSKPILLVIAFALLLATIIFLPYSQKLFDMLLPESKEEPVEKITNGQLICSMESDDDSNSFQYTETYIFSNSEVDSLEHEVLIQGDADYLNQRNNQCNILKQTATSISGVTIDCDLSSEEMIEKQFFNLSRFDAMSIDASFTEAGGVLPNSKKGDSYKEVKRVMEMSGYDCKIK